MDFKTQIPAVSDDLQSPLSTTFPTTTTESSDSERHVPTKSSSKLTSSESDKLSVLPGAPTHTTGTVTSPKTSTQRPTNFGLATAQTKRGYRRSLDAFTGSTSFPSFSSNNLSFESHTPLNHLVWDGGLNAGMNSLPFPRTRVGSASSDADGGGTRTPKKRERVSFDGTSGSGSLPTMRSVGQAFSRLQERGSDPIPSSPAIRTSAFTSERPNLQRGRARHPGADSKSPNTDINLNSRSSSPSHTRSRAASPLRILQQWSAGLHRDHTTHHGRPAEERFVPVNPFKRRTHLSWSWCCASSSSPPDLENGAIPASSSNSSSNGPYNCDDLNLTFISITSIKSFGEAARVFLSDTLPRQVYLNFLLRLPAMYFSRVARVFEDAEVSRPDIERMIDSIQVQVRVQGVVDDEPVNGAVPFRGSGERVSLAGMEPRVYPPDQGAGVSANGLGYPQANVTTLPPLPFPEDWTPPLVSPSLIRFKHSWEAFIDSLLREWKTLNVVSALLASAILTIFQIPEAADDPITRSAALLSLICALMSLSYGCMYIVRFGTMRSMYRASKWAEEARRTNTVIWWNVWVLLAMPAVWMSWSMFFFLASILSFVWRTGSEDDPSSRAPLSTTAVLGPRVAITGVLVLGLVYLAMIVKTLMRYGRGWGGSRLAPCVVDNPAHL